jgi:hypothetical protein
VINEKKFAFGWMARIGIKQMFLAIIEHGLRESFAAGVAMHHRAGVLAILNPYIRGQFLTETPRAKQRPM